MKLSLAGLLTGRIKPGQWLSSPQAGPASGLAPLPGAKNPAPAVPGVTSQGPVEQKVQWLLPRRGSVSAPLATILDPVLKVNILSVLGAGNEHLARLEQRVSNLLTLADAKQLQSAMAHSGFFAEGDLRRLLVASGAGASADIRSILLRLLARLNEAQGRSSAGSGPEQALAATLRRQLEGALATIALNQLASSRVEDSKGALWLFDIPLRVGQSLGDLGVMIERRAPSSPGEQAEAGSWRVLIRVSLPRLGPLAAELVLTGRRVSVALCAESRHAARELQARLPLLRRGLSGCDLEVTALSCRQGTLGTAATFQQAGVDITI